MSYYAINGLGVDASCNTVSYKTKKGVEGQGQLCASGIYCGSGKGEALQQALNDLGYGPIDVDGAIGTQTYGALAKVAAKHNILYTQNTPPESNMCEILATEWNEKYYGPAPTTAAVPGSSASATTPASRLQLDRVKARAMFSLANRAKLMSGSTTREGTLPANAGVMDKASAWWNGMGTVGKVGVVAGGVAVLGLIAYAIAKPGRQVEMQVMKANKGHRASAWFDSQGNRFAAKDLKSHTRGGSGVVYRHSSSGWEMMRMDSEVDGGWLESVSKSDVPKKVLAAAGYSSNCSSCMTPNGGHNPGQRRRHRYTIANDQDILRSFDMAFSSRKHGDIKQYAMLRSGLRKMVSRHKGKGGTHAQIVRRANEAIRRVTRAMALTYKMNKRSLFTVSY